VDTRPANRPRRGRLAGRLPRNPITRDGGPHAKQAWPAAFGRSLPRGPGCSGSPHESRACAGDRNRACARSDLAAWPRRLDAARPRAPAGLRRPPGTRGCR